jgi:hypothetical protein
MEPKFIGGKHKKQTKMEPVVDLNADVQTVVHQIIEDLKEKQNEDLRSKLAVSWKELEWCSVKMGGNVLELRVVCLDGALREPKKHPTELQKKRRQVYDMLHRLEKAVRKEFRERTGKALTWNKPKEHADFEMIALNGLYRFFAVKVGEVKTSLPGQSFDE